MSRHDIIVIGASAGGVEALKELAALLPADLNAAVFVVVHFPATSVSLLASLMTRFGPLPAVDARNGGVVEPGFIYVAQPDYHLLLEPGMMRLNRGPKENHTRPAIDPLFRTAAHAYGPRVIGVVLSGMLNDGTAGLIEIKRRGGIAIAQNPQDAAFPDMPRSAIRDANVDYVLDIPHIAETLARLTQSDPEVSVSLPASNAPDAPKFGGNPHHAFTHKEDATVDIVDMKPDGEPLNPFIDRDSEAQIKGKRNGQLSIFSCPDCGGVLWQMDNEGLLQFRCHVGHAYSGEALLQHQGEALESAMWYAMRMLVDRAKLNLQMAQRARERGHFKSAEIFEARAQTSDQHALSMRLLIESSALQKQGEEAGSAPVVSGG